MLFNVRIPFQLSQLSLHEEITQIALVGMSQKAVGYWKTMISNAVADWFLHNSLPLGGPGKVVEIDEAKFGKRKFNKGSYREGMWEIGGVD